MKKIILFLSLSWFFSIASAQKLVAPEFKPVDHELSVFFGSGIYTGLYKTEQFNKNWGLGCSFGIHYTFYFRPEWGILTGFRFATYKSTIKGTLNEEYVAFNGSDFVDYTIYFKDIKETHRYSFMQIPFMAHCKYPFKSVMIYGSAGFHIGFNVNTNYQTEFDEIKTNAYDLKTHKVIVGDLINGYGTYLNQRIKSKSVVKMNYSLCLESGVEVFIKSRHSIQLGLFFEYGLNNIAQGVYPINRILDYKENFGVGTYNGNLKLRGVIESGSNKPYFEKIKLMAFGIKVGYILGIPQ